MNHAVLINAMLSPAQWNAVSEHMRYAESLLHKAEKLAAGKDIYVIADAEKFGELGHRIKGLGKIAVQSRKASHVLSEVYDAIKSYEDCLYFFIDTPLIDVGISQSMLDLHRNEIAEYTYGEGFPVGVTPEVMKVDLIPRIISLLRSDDGELQRDTIFTSLQKEINSFDIETYFAHRDMKLRRMELTLSPRRYRVITEQVIQRAGAECNYEQFCRLVEEEPGILRSLPSFVEVEVTNRTNGSCAYLPHASLERGTGDMDLETYRNCIDRLSSFTDQFHITFSNMGEPLLNPDIRAIIEYTLENPDVRLILESDGHLFTPDFADYVAGLNNDHMSVIFDVDAVQEETYRKIHRGDLRRVERNIRYLLSKVPANVYVQMVRMDENEGEMLAFYDQWESDGAQIIIQKYNTYLGTLPKRSQADLRPLDRQPCWHLMRDLVVLHNGDVPRCKQDINASFLLGNMNKNPIEEIWRGNESVYLDHCAGNYDGVCDICDEYYTFNF